MGGVFGNNTIGRIPDSSRTNPKTEAAAAAAPNLTILTVWRIG
jgi:hypothetical protein